MTQRAIVTGTGVVLSVTALMSIGFIVTRSPAPQAKRSSRLPWARTYWRRSYGLPWGDFSVRWPLLAQAKPVPEFGDMLDVDSFSLLAKKRGDELLLNVSETLFTNHAAAQHFFTEIQQGTHPKKIITNADGSEVATGGTQSMAKARNVFPVEIAIARDTVWFVAVNAGSPKLDATMLASFRFDHHPSVAGWPVRPSHSPATGASPNGTAAVSGRGGARSAKR